MSGFVAAGAHPSVVTAARANAERNATRIIATSLPDQAPKRKRLSLAVPFESRQVPVRWRQREHGRHAVAQLPEVVGAPAADAAAGHQRAGVRTAAGEAGRAGQNVDAGGVPGIALHLRLVADRAEPVVTPAAD